MYGWRRRFRHKGGLTSCFSCPVQCADIKHSDIWSRHLPPGHLDLSLDTSSHPQLLRPPGSAAKITVGRGLVCWPCFLMSGPRVCCVVVAPAGVWLCCHKTRDVISILFLHHHPAAAAAVLQFSSRQLAGPGSALVTASQWDPAPTTPWSSLRKWAECSRA